LKSLAPHSDWLLWKLHLDPLTSGLCLFLCSSDITAEPGQTVTLTSKPGEDVTLQCRGPKDDNVVMLRWVRPDLKSGGYVFYFRENRRNEDHQYESFHGRVDLRDPEMKDGDFSVILKNVRISDTGSYECYVGIKGNNITAEPGQTVTLPCRAPSSSEIRTVEWTRPGLDPEEIFVYLDGRFDPDNQHPSFRERVELKDSQMRDGDVSVTLKDVTFTDTGTYECRVFQGQSKAPELTSIVHLKVSAGECVFVAKGKPHFDLGLKHSKWWRFNIPGSRPLP
uniref:Ig-like domain-containing protein n=1 Tax=Mastacembelus armatus TaxID=205130 RepID=A0A3Q3LN55_9TELE